MEPRYRGMEVMETLYGTGMVIAYYLNNHGLISLDGGTDRHVRFNVADCDWTYDYVSDKHRRVEVTYYESERELVAAHVSKRQVLQHAGTITRSLNRNGVGLIKLDEPLDFPGYPDELWFYKSTVDCETFLNVGSRISCDIFTSAKGCPKVRRVWQLAPEDEHLFQPVAIKET